MGKPKCVIVDDEDVAIAALKSHLEEIDLLEVERVFNDPDKFLSQIDQLQSRILFLDMDMSIYGDEVAREIGDRMNVIFVSGRPDKAIDSYNVEAIDFVTKPIRQNRLKKAINKVLEKFASNKPGSIAVRTAEAHRHEIIVSNIVYIVPYEEDARDKLIYIDGNQKPLKAKNINFKELLERSTPSNLLQISKNCIVNLDFVQKLRTRDSIEIDHFGKPIELTLSESCKEQFFEAKPLLR